MEIPATLPSPVSRSPPRPTSRRVSTIRFGAPTFLPGRMSSMVRRRQPDQFNLRINEITTQRNLFSFQETHTFAHNLVNSARFGVNRVVAEIGLTPTALQPIVRGQPFGLRKPRRRIAILYNVCTV